MRSSFREAGISRYFSSPRSSTRKSESWAIAFLFFLMYDEVLDGLYDEYSSFDETKDFCTMILNSFFVYMESMYEVLALIMSGRVTFCEKPDLRTGHLFTNMLLLELMTSKYLFAFFTSSEFFTGKGAFSMKL